MDVIVEHAEAWRQHADANQAWVDGRHRAAAEAASAVIGQRVGQATRVWPKVAQIAAWEAGNAAAAQYERTVPRPTWEGRATEVLHHVAEGEAAS